MDVLRKLKGEIVVSSQAAPDEPLYKEMSKMRKNISISLL